MNKLTTTATPRVFAWSPQRIDTRRLLVGMWMCLFLVHGLIYLAVIPPWQSPDEPTSVELLLTMESRGRLVSTTDLDPNVQRAIIASMERTNYWNYGFGRKPTNPDALFKDIWYGRTQLHRPPFYHLLLLPLDRLLADWRLEDRLYVLHAASLLLVSITVSIAAIIGWMFADEVPALAWVLPALVALHPQLAVIGVSVNSDNLAGVLGALVFWGLLLVARYGLSWRRCLLLALLLLLGFVTKRTTLFLVPTVLFGLIQPLRAAWGRAAPRTRRRTLFVVSGGAAALVVLLGISPIGARLLLLGNGYLFDFAARGRFSMLIAYLREPPMPIGQWFRQHVIFLNRTFWADVGWHRGVLPPAVATTLLTVTVSAWLTSLLVVLIRRSQFQPWQRQFIAVCWVGLILCLLQTLLRYYITPLDPPHGRYLFPVFLPMIFLIALGLCGWWRARWQRWLSPIVVFAAVAFDLYTILGVLIPAFYA